jgi:cytochrome c peroxidase
MLNLKTVLLTVLCLVSLQLHAQEDEAITSPQAKQAQPANTLSPASRHQALTALGKQLFHDPQLSASGKLSCASCHQAQHAFTPGNKLPVQKGGDHMQLMGTRAVPTLMYLQSTPPFTEHYSEDEGLQPGFDNGPAGGFTWDGRVSTLSEQAKIPLFSANEMASTPALLAKRIRKAYSASFMQLFGEAGLQSDTAITDGILLALQTYQQDATEFAPYSSKFDHVMQGQARFTPLEEKGLQLFMDPNKGNCASCHQAAVIHGALPQFTDHGYAALGLPRNQQIAQNHDRHYFDLGLCGPARRDLHEEYCGFFKVPTLRNVARKKSFFHNGVVHTLRDAVRFYAERDTAPEKWYPQDRKGRLQKYNDQPEKYRDNIETKAPFGQQAGDKAPLDAQEIDAIVAFLKTLNDEAPLTGSLKQASLKQGSFKPASLAKASSFKDSSH